MSLATDKQTLDDLNIFGKRGTEGLYALYNRAYTRGGAALLEELFQYPLADEAAINARSTVIRFFSEKEIAFPFQNEWLDAAEQYLSNTDERSRLSEADNTWGRKLNQLVAADTETKTIQKGIAGLISLLQVMRQFADTVRTQVAAIPYRQELEVIDSLLAEASFSPLFGEQHPGKLSFEKLTEYDRLLRFRHRDILYQLLRHIYQVDVYLSIGRVAREKQWVFPTALPRTAQTVMLEDFYHPALTKPVVNTLVMKPDSNIVFLTGANMAGKSTFMKSLGIAMYLAHMGFPIAASRMEFSVRDGIFTTINLPDNLSQGTSHFYAEVLRIKKVAEELSRDKYLFVIFDELFRGTNVKDAYEATIAVTAGVARRQHCLFVVSTHIIEAGEVLQQQCANINFAYLPTLMEGNKPIYPHKLAQGITADRHGMVIIQNEGILNILGRKKIRNQPS